MGLNSSADKFLGWRTQYKAMLRWHSRCQSVHNKDGCYTSIEDAIDFISAFFIFCYHLRDYAIETGGISKEDIDLLIDKNTNMRICRDICTRVKHHTISQPSSIKKAVDIDWSFGRERQLSTSGEKLFLAAGDEKLDPMAVVHGCVNFWDKVISDGVLKEPSDPYHQSAK